MIQTETIVRVPDLENRLVLESKEIAKHLRAVTQASLIFGGVLRESSGEVITAVLFRKLVVDLLEGLSVRLIIIAEIANLRSQGREVSIRCQLVL